MLVGLWVGLTSVDGCDKTKKSIEKSVETKQIIVEETKIIKIEPNEKVPMDTTNATKTSTKTTAITTDKGITTTTKTVTTETITAKNGKEPVKVIRNNSPNQKQLDSIAAAKTKGKIKN